MFEAERARSRQIWMENALKAEFAKAEERERRVEIKGGRSRSVTGGEAVVLHQPGLLVKHS